MQGSSSPRRKSLIVRNDGSIPRSSHPPSFLSELQSENLGFEEEAVANEVLTPHHASATEESMSKLFRIASTLSPSEIFANVKNSQLRRKQGNVIDPHDQEQAKLRRHSDSVVESQGSGGSGPDRFQTSISGEEIFDEVDAKIFTIVQFSEAHRAALRATFRRWQKWAVERVVERKKMGLPKRALVTVNHQATASPRRQLPRGPLSSRTPRQSIEPKAFQCKRPVTIPLIPNVRVRPLPRVAQLPSRFVSDASPRVKVDVSLLRVLHRAERRHYR